MSVGLWAAQVLAAIFFGLHGALFWRPEGARARLPYAAGLSDTVLRIVAVAELAGAVGLVLPAVTGVLPWLTPLAGVGLTLTMALAIVFHIGRREWPNIGLNFFLGALAAFISYGRLVLEPF